MKNPFHRSTSLEKAFTLTELLVVIGLMVLLAGLGVAAFKGGSSSDGSRGASYIAAGLFDAARNEAIMRRVPTRVIFDTFYNASLPENYLHRMTVAYSTNNGTTWTPSTRWIKFPANAYFDVNNTPASGNPRSRAFDTNMTLGSGFGSGVSAGTTGYWAYEYLPNGQANYFGISSPPLKVVFSPGSTLGGQFAERPDLTSLYGFVVNKLGHTQQFADLLSLTNCP